MALITCPTCGNRLDITEQEASSGFKCPSCGGVLSVQSDNSKSTAKTKPRKPKKGDIIFHCHKCFGQVSISKDESDSQYANGTAMLCPYCDTPLNYPRLWRGLLNPKKNRPIPLHIGGWLILPAIGLIGGIIWLALGLGITIFLSENEGSDIVFMFLVSGPILAFYIITAHLFFGHSRFAPGVMIFCYLLGGLLSLSSWLLYSVNSPSEIVESMIGILIPVIFILYFATSKRVKATFKWCN